MRTPAPITVADLELLFELVVEIFGLSFTVDLSLGDFRMRQLPKLKDNDMRKLVPSKESIFEHALRAAYQAGYV